MFLVVHFDGAGAPTIYGIFWSYREALIWGEERFGEGKTHRVMAMEHVGPPPAAVARQAYEEG